MKKFSVIALAMTATLALGACSTEDEPEEPTAVEQTSEDTGGDNAGATSDDMAAETGDAASGTGDAASQTGNAASYSEPACQEFFTEGGPLADRAETARAALDAGEVTDSVAVSEVTTLKSRIDATAEAAPEDISALLTEVNAPFAEVVEAKNADGVDPETGEITLPEIDTQASADAQAELETACAG